MGRYINAKIKDLLIWSDNPRHSQLENVEESLVIELLWEEVGKNKMMELIKDIASNGLSPHKFPIVVNKDDSLYVYDGNRRISAYKYLAKNDENDDFSLETEIKVYCTSEEEAYRIMELEHNGEQKGVGVIPWEAYQKDFSYGKRGLTVIYQNAYYVSNICGLSKKKDFKRIPYTDLDSIFLNKKITEIFNENGVWDFQNEEYIKKVYQILINVKPHGVSYSRYLKTINNNTDAFSAFKDKVDNELVQPIQIQAQSFSSDDMVNSKLCKDDNTTNNIVSNQIPSLEANTAKVSSITSEEDPLPNHNQAKRNNYKSAKYVLFQFQGCGLKFLCQVYNTNYLYIEKKGIDEHSQDALIAPFLYRLLLECAIRKWLEKYHNESILKRNFNIGNLNEKKFKEKNFISDFLSIVVSEKNKVKVNDTSLVTSERILTLISIISQIKNNEKMKEIKKIKKGESYQKDLPQIIDEINSVMHGTKTNLGFVQLKEIDRLVKQILMLLSVSLNN
jgi:uncharacterized FlaG/YvyC family protein